MYPLLSRTDLLPWPEGVPAPRDIAYECEYERHPVDMFLPTADYVDGVRRFTVRLCGVPGPSGVSPRLEGHGYAFDAALHSAFAQTIQTLKKTFELKLFT